MFGIILTILVILILCILVMLILIKRTMNISAGSQKNAPYLFTIENEESKNSRLYKKELKSFNVRIYYFANNYINNVSLNAVATEFY